MRQQVLAAMVTALIAGWVVPSMAQSADDRFPSQDPDPRVGTPNDPRFDCFEPDDEDPNASCDSVFDQQYGLFGFAPSATLVTIYKDGPKIGQPMVSGVAADLAWKVTTGDPRVVIAVTDTGIRWDDADLRTKVFLNAAELPVPAGASRHDADGDGVFTVDDYLGDPRVSDTNGTGALDGQDLIRAFSDGVDDDANGYVDDIAGWDWLNDDNDPADTSSHSSARNHGTGRMQEAAQATNDGQGEAGICPDCRVLPLKVWDSFVVPGDNWALATVYTADIGAQVQVVANGVLGNTESMREATRYAYDHDVALMHVSSDLNTANHNYPTNYPWTIFINGCVADVEGAGGSGNEIFGPLSSLGLPVDVPIGTWFRQSNLTQHGAHAHVCFMASTGSQATGQAGGAAGLVVSRGLERADELGGPLTANEVKQILTMTAEDVLLENTLGVGIPDPAQLGFDEHFGYGRADLIEAVERVAVGRIPPEVFIDSPQWWALVDPTDPTGELPVTGRVAGLRSTETIWGVDWAPGVSPEEGDFVIVGSGSTPDAFTGELGSILLGDIANALPGSRDGTPPTDPNDYVITVRVRATDAEGNRGEDRRAVHVFHDPDQPAGWPRFVDTGGESSLVTWDLDGDGQLEIIEGDSSGRLSVTRPDGTPLRSFNGGQPFAVPPVWNHHPQAPGFASGAVPPVLGQLRTPVVGDLDADLDPEVLVATMDGRFFLLDRTGQVEPGWPVSVDPARSAETVQTADFHVKRGLLGNPSAADLDGDGDLEVVAAALDGHVYVWEHDGRPRPGFPVLLFDGTPNETGAGGELIVTPAIGDLDGDGLLEIVAMSNEVHDIIRPDVPDSFEDVQAETAGLLISVLSEGLGGGTTRLYAIDADGATVAGWPVPVDSALPDVLPLVGPGHTVGLADLDGDGADEVVLSVTAGDVTILDGDGSVQAVMPASPTVGGNGDIGRVLNLFEYVALGDVTGDGAPDITKLGLTLNGLVNLVAVGQNLPFDHVVQAWDPTTGAAVPGFPTPIDDYGLLSRPAIADLDGDGAGDILATSGLYLLHAYGQGAVELDGFPKLTGGWGLGVPTVADLDGDGDLELLASTREGWRHLWDLDAVATPAALNGWWVDGHDEQATNRAGADVRPPVRIVDLTADGEAIDTGEGGLVLSFTAPGDDWHHGPAAAYEVRLSRAAADATTWSSVAPTTVATVPSSPGTAERLSLDVPGGTRSVAILAVDDVGNRGMVAALDLGPSQPPEPEPLPATGAAGGAGPLVLLGLTVLLLVAGRPPRRRGTVRLRNGRVA